MMSAMGNTQRSMPEMQGLQMQPMLSHSNPIHRSIRNTSRRQTPAQMTLRINTLRNETSRNAGINTVEGIDHEPEGSEVL